MRIFALGQLKVSLAALGIALLSAVAPAAAQSEGQALHVFVGKSVVINLQSPVTRILSSNPTVIDTLATSPTQVVVEGKSAGASSLILWDASGHSQMLDVTVDVNVAHLRTAIEQTYPGQPITVQSDGAHLIVTGTVSVFSHDDTRDAAHSFTFTRNIIACQEAPKSFDTPSDGHPSPLPITCPHCRRVGTSGRNQALLTDPWVYLTDGWAGTRRRFRGVWGLLGRAVCDRTLVPGPGQGVAGGDRAQRGLPLAPGWGSGYACGGRPGRPLPGGLGLAALRGKAGGVGAAPPPLFSASAP